jgi:hypothetical protein
MPRKSRRASRRGVPGLGKGQTDGLLPVDAESEALPAFPRSNDIGECIPNLRVQKIESSDNGTAHQPAL